MNSLVKTTDRVDLTPAQTARMGCSRFLSPVSRRPLAGRRDGPGSTFVFHEEGPESVFENRLISRQAGEHETDHCQIDHRLAGLGLVFLIAIESSVASQPAEGAFDHPREFSGCIHDAPRILSTALTADESACLVNSK